MKPNRSLLAKSLALAIALSSLGGCGTLTPMEHKSSAATTPSKATRLASTFSGWDDTPVVNDGESSVVLHTPARLPQSVYDKHISLKFNSQATVRDIAAILGEQGIPVVLPRKETGDKSFYLPSFNGKLGDLLSVVSSTTDTWFIWSHGFIVASDYARIAIDIPQEQEFGASLKRGLTAMGVGHGSLSWEAGMATADVTPSDFRKVRAFLTQLTNNAVVVNLQVAVINVSLNQDANQGINWGALSAAATAGGGVPGLTAANNLVFPSGTGGSQATGTTSPVVGGTTGATGTSGAGTTAATPSTSTSLARAVGGLVLSGGSLQGALFTNRFSFSGMFDFLENYGTANTTQNVVLRTIAGTPTKFKSVTQVPYVSSVGVTTTASAGAASSLGSTSTSTANDGIEVELTPSFDASANTVTVGLKLVLQAVLGFNNLSAGNQIGSLTQPTTADQTLLDALRLRPGQTVVVGGLTYNTVSDSKNAPVALVRTDLEHKSLTVKRQTMFVVIRPTIVKFGKVREVEASGDGGSIADAVTRGGVKLSDSDVGKPSSGSLGSMPRNGASNTGTTSGNTGATSAATPGNGVATTTFGGSSTNTSSSSPISF